MLFSSPCEIAHGSDHENIQSRGIPNRSVFRPFHRIFNIQRKTDFGLSVSMNSFDLTAAHD